MLCEFVIVDKFSKLELLVPLGQDIIWILNQSSVELSDDVGFKEIHLLWIREHVHVAAFFLRDGPKLVDEFCHFLSWGQVAQSNFVVGEYAELNDVLFKAQVGQMLQISLSLHTLIYQPNKREAILFLDKISVVLSVHFPHFRHVYLFLYLCFGAVLCPKTRVLKKQEPPNFPVLLNKTFHISNKDILLLLFQVSQLDIWDTVDAFIAFYAVKLE
jgi:hypothetical protein